MNQTQSPEIDAAIQNLEKEVQQYSTPSQSYSLSSFSLNVVYIYISIPIIIFIILRLWSPRFVMASDNPADDIEDYKISYTKILMYTLIFGGLLDFAVFVYNRRNNPTS